MSNFTKTRINLEIDRLQSTFDILKTDLVTYPANQSLCIILFSTITALKDSLEYEESLENTNTYKGETIPFSIESIKQREYV